MKVLSIVLTQKGSFYTKKIDKSSGNTYAVLCQIVVFQAARYKVAGQFCVYTPYFTKNRDICQ